MKIDIDTQLAIYDCMVRIKEINDLGHMLILNPAGAWFGNQLMENKDIVKMRNVLNDRQIHQFMRLKEYLK